MPSSSRRQDFILGVAVLAFIVLLLMSVMFIYPRVGKATRRVLIQFKHDQGVAPLKDGSPVMLAGSLQVGKVTDVAYETITRGSGPGERKELAIVVEAEISRDLPLYEDCRITTSQPPVGGGGIVVIQDAGTFGRRQIGESEVIHGRPAQGLASVINNLSEALLGPGGIVEEVEQILDPKDRTSLVYRVRTSLDDLNAITSTLRLQTDPDEQRTLMHKVQLILEHLAQATAALREEVQAGNDTGTIARLHTVLDRLDQGLTQAAEMLRENRPALRNTLSNVERASETIEAEMLAQLRAELDRDDPESLLGKLHAGMDRINGSLDDLSEMTALSRRTLAANRPAIEDIIGNVRTTSAQLKLASEEIRSAPWRLLYRPGTREQQQLTVFDAARSFAEAAMHLDEAASRLEVVMELSGVAETEAQGREEISRTLEALQSAFERFERAESYLWEQMK